MHSKKKFFLKTSHSLPVQYCSQLTKFWVWVKSQFPSVRVRVQLYKKRPSEARLLESGVGVIVVKFDVKHLKGKHRSLFMYRRISWLYAHESACRPLNTGACPCMKFDNYRVLIQLPMSSCYFFSLKKLIKKKVWLLVESQVLDSSATTLTRSHTCRVLHAGSLFVPRWMPVLVRQRNGNLTAAEGERRTKGRDEHVHGAHAQGAQAWKEGVAQLYARHHEPKEWDRERKSVKLSLTVRTD